jgi:Skp family chaperone for outer membrane proteins
LTSALPAGSGTRFNCKPNKIGEIMRRMFLTIPAIALACATSSPSQQMSGTRHAQDDAQQQYQNAAGAQKHASEEQQKAEQAARDVTAAQKALADAQAKLEGQQAKAAQAQRDAGKLGHDAQELGALMQVQATQLQGQEAQEGKRTEQGNQRAWTETRNVSGTVAAVSASGLTVRSDGSADVKLQVTGSTAVNLDGRAASLRDIKAGSEVRASYGVIDGKTTAVQLDVTSK